ncbi:hypothetical protein PROFUN_01458 [Planoprotostelium fungivorum]|uniref:Uncharacterized protein n=1 Tax=Planoprotostelium fungivorum TaxID=1890364 RepID=A0A2P6NTD1_9EUKA|nr:hypothetical protein PROFUN_01458 [Planoprotostelium fungivorum]
MRDCRLESSGRLYRVALSVTTTYVRMVECLSRSTTKRQKKVIASTNYSVSYQLERNQGKWSSRTWCIYQLLRDVTPSGFSAIAKRPRQSAEMIYRHSQDPLFSQRNVVMPPTVVTQYTQPPHSK